ncbi:MAG TPA: DUF72 domain-containing protein [Thermoanaerobaculia bacterium]
MEVIVGTSGYSYKEWKGSFYPADLPAAKMLSFYAQQFRTVEINNTFYRMPEEKTLSRWITEVPPDFKFVLKVPQRITHQKKLSGVEADFEHFFTVATALGPALGPVLVQLPPYLRKDVAKLESLLSLVPEGRSCAVEVRHASWLDAEVYDVLRARNAALVAADTDEVGEPDALITPTGNWGYLRLRRTDYSEADLTAWARRVEAKDWTTAWIFFKHEDEGKGPAYAKLFRDALR